MNRTDIAWLLAVMGLSSALCLSAGRTVGATFDEPFYIEKGLEHWRSGSYRTLMRAGTMPLPVDVQTLPLHLWERGRGVPFQPATDLGEALPVARAMTLPFWWLLLLSSFRLARRFGGSWAGRFAVAFTACEPNLLAHAALATTDIAVTAALLAFAESVLRGRGRAWRGRVLVPAIWYGVALLCKASAALFCPLILLVLAWPIARTWCESKPRLLDLAQMFALAAVAMFAYCGSDWQAQHSFVTWADSQDSTGVRFAAHHLKVFPNAGEGFVMQAKHNIRGHGCYTLGEWHPRAVWYYFPVVFSQKLTEPTLLLLAFALLFRTRRLANPMFGIALLFFAFSLTCRVQIGIRLQFPCIAFLLIGLAVSVAPGSADLTPRPPLRNGEGEKIRRRSFAVMGLSLLAALLVAGESWPDGLRFCNQFWGGAERAPELLADSNCDWGQSLPELHRWAHERGIERLPLWYYGADPAARQAPFELMQINHWSEPSIAGVREKAAPSRLLAVGLSLLNGCPDRRPETLAVIAWLKGQKRIATVGTTAVFEIE